MPSWSSKDEKMYEHIKEGAQKRGTKSKRAKAIAARTVNKRRRTEGRTPNKTTKGTGNPSKPLQERTKDELYNMAKKKNVEGRSHMNKQQLVSALKKS
jgi:hypothetical protein